MNKRLVISNAFSVSMLLDERVLKFRKISLEEAREMVKRFSNYSIIGHEGTAKIFSELLNANIPPNRVFYNIQENDILLVGSFNQRLPEGKVLSYEEMINIPIVWWVIEVIE